MKVYLNRFTALILVCTLVVTSLSVSSFATDYQSTYNFWNWLYDNGWFVGKSIASTADSVCSVSDDGLHHATQHTAGFAGGGRDGERVYTCVCDACGQTFEAVATNLEETYNQVETERDVNDGYNVIDSRGYASGVGEWKVVDVYAYTATYGLAIDDVNHAHVHVQDTASSFSGNHSFHLAYYFKFPYDATIVFDGPFTFQAPELGYTGDVEAFGQFTEGGAYSGAGLGSFVDNKRTFNARANVVYYYKSKTVAANKGVSGDAYFTLPDVYQLLDDPALKYQEIPVYGGGNLSFSVDGGTQYKNIEFINTETNTFYNPVTDNSQVLQSWNYDYVNRTYTGYTENGEVKVVYGDEYISVVEDGNTYNYYYASPTDGSGSGSDDGSSGDDEGLFGKLGKLLGTLLGGLIDLITGVLFNVMDNLIALVTMTIEKLGSIVNLFGSFGDALRSLWSWLPDDIITILSAGVSVVIFACVIKLFI